MNRPPRLRFVQAYALLCLALAAACLGQDNEPSRDTARPLSARDPIPELPVNGLLDEGNIFSAEERSFIAADIEDFRTRITLPLYLVTANYIFGDTVDNYGERLVKEGLKGRSGVIILFERGSGRLVYSATPGALGRAEDMKLIFLAASRAAAFLPEESTLSQRLRAAVQSLTTTSEQWKKTGALPESGSTPAPPPLPPASVVKETLPPPPADFLRDDADAFSTATEAALKSELVKWHAQFDMDVYIITNTWLPDITAQGLSEKLAREWLADRFGAVLVMNRGTGLGENALGITGSAKNEMIVPGAELLQSLEHAKTKAIEIRDSPGGTFPRGVQEAARIIMQTLATRGAPARDAQAQTTSPGQWGVMTGVAAALLAGAALLFAFHRFQERLDSKSNEQLLFPDVTVGRRLGAPHGGGKVASITFGRKAP